MSFQGGMQKIEKINSEIIFSFMKNFKVKFSTLSFRDSTRLEILHFRFHRSSNLHRKMFVQNLRCQESLEILQKFLNLDKEQFT